MTLLAQVSRGSSYPVTLDEAKAQTRIDGTDSDTLLNTLIGIATGAVSEMVGWALTGDQWSYSLASASGDVRLPKGPVASIDSITYFDTDDAAQSATVSDFYLFKDTDMAIVRPKQGAEWPVTFAREDALTITFTTSAPAVLPLEIKHAILLMVSHMYDERGTATEKQMHEVPYAVRDLVSLHRRGWIC